MSPGQPPSGATLADAGTLLLELLPKFLGELGSDTPIELGIEALSDALSILGAGLVTVAEGKPLEEARRAIDDALVDRLETFRAGPPPVPL